MSEAVDLPARPPTPPADRSPNPPSRAGDDRATPVEEILASYLTAAESGTAPSIDELLTKHPGQAAELSEFLALRQSFDRMLQRPRDPDAAPDFPMPFGEYILLNELGVGGMGLVFHARHTPTGRVVALKVLRSGRFASTAERRRFRTEAEACLALDHPGIVPVYAVGEHDGQPFFTMRLMSGGSLAEKRPERCPTIESAVRLVADLAAAVDHAHRRGILHRDLKPSNVLFDADGRAYLSDFGLAKLQGASGSDLTRTGAAVGTPAYMAPEQGGGRTDSVTTASDVYGLGGLLFFALTGRAPLDPVRPALEMPQPSLIASHVPRDLDAICLTCMAAEPSRRYASAADLGADLQRFLTGEPVKARRASRPERVIRAIRRNPVASLLSLVAIAGIATTGYFAYQDYANTRRLNADLTNSLTREGQHLKDLTEALQLEAEQRERLTAARDTIRLKSACDAYTSGMFEDAAESLRLLRPEPGESDRRGFVWHYLDGLTQSRRAFRGHRRGALSVAIDADGRTAASAANDGSIRLWDLDTGDSIASWSVSEERRFLRFRPQKDHLAAVSSWLKSPNDHRHSVKLFDRAGKLLAERDEPAWEIHAVEWSGNGAELYLAGEDKEGRGALTAWNPETGAAAALPIDPDRPLRALSRSPDGKAFAASWRLRSAPGHNDIFTFPVGHPEKRTAARLRHAAPIESIDYSPDGTRIAAVAVDTTVFVLDSATLRTIWKRQLHARPSRARIIWTDGGQSLALFWDDGQTNELHVLDAATGSERPERHESRVGSEGLARDPSARGFLFASGDGLVRYRSTPVPAYQPLVGHEREVWSVAFHPDGRLLASGSDDHTIRLWDVATRKEQKVLRGHEALVMALAFSPDGRHLYSASWDFTVRIWDVATGAQWASWKAHDAPVAAIAVTRDGKQLITDSRDGTIKVWDIATRTEVAKLTGQKRRVHSLSLSPDGQRLAAPGPHHQVQEWDTATWKEVRVLQAEQPVAAVAYSPDGSELIYCTAEGAVGVWNLATGATRLWFRNHPKGSFALVPADSQSILSAGEDNTHVWDLKSGQSLLRFKHPSIVYSMAMSPDNRTLATTCHDGVVRLWSVRER